MPVNTVFLESGLTLVNAKADLQFDFNIVSCGRDETLPAGNRWGPLLRDHYLLQYVLHGSGTFILNGCKYPMKAGQCFLSFPGTTLLELADNEDPWGLMWVSIKSLRPLLFLDELGITSETPVLPWSDTSQIAAHMNAILEAEHPTQSSKLTQMGHAFLLFAEMARLHEQNTKEHSMHVRNKYVHDAIHFMERNYSEPIKISAIAQHIGLNRSYFFSLFKEQTGISPQEYLIQLRMKTACELFANPDATVATVAYSLGYEPRVLSRLFKKVTGYTPTEYKKMLLNSTQK